MKIKNQYPKEAEAAPPEERAAILAKLSQYVTTNSILTLDGEQRRGTHPGNGTQIVQEVKNEND